MQKFHPIVIKPRQTRLIVTSCCCHFLFFFCAFQHRLRCCPNRNKKPFGWTERKSFMAWKDGNTRFQSWLRLFSFTARSKVKALQPSALKGLKGSGPGVSLVNASEAVTSREKKLQQRKVKEQRDDFLRVDSTLQQRANAKRHGRSPSRPPVSAPASARARCQSPSLHHSQPALGSTDLTLTHTWLTRQNTHCSGGCPKNKKKNHKRWSKVSRLGSAPRRSTAGSSGWETKTFLNKIWGNV